MTHILQRRDTAATWTSLNPVLMEGEAGHERDTGREKLGDGVTAWVDLPYKFGVDSVAGKTGEVELEVADVDGAAPLASPVFTGNPTAPTPNPADDDTSVATTAFVKAQEYAPLASPVFTGNPTAPTPAPGDDDTSIATTAFVKAEYAPLASPVFTGNPTAPTPAPSDDDTSIATTAFVKEALADVLASWTAYTPAVTPWIVTDGWFRYRRVGQTLQAQGSFTASFFAAGSLAIPLPPGMTGFMSLGGLIQSRAIGTWTAFRVGVARYGGVAVLHTDGVSILFLTESTPFYVQYDNPATWADDDVFTFAVELELQADP